MERGEWDLSRVVGRYATMGLDHSSLIPFYWSYVPLHGQWFGNFHTFLINIAQWWGSLWAPWVHSVIRHQTVQIYWDLSPTVQLLPLVQLHQTFPKGISLQQTLRSPLPQTDTTITSPPDTYTGQSYVFPVCVKKGRESEWHTVTKREAKSYTGKLIAYTAISCSKEQPHHYKG